MVMADLVRRVVVGSVVYLLRGVAPYVRSFRRDIHVKKRKL